MRWLDAAGAAPHAMTFPLAGAPGQGLLPPVRPRPPCAREGLDPGAPRTRSSKPMTFRPGGGAGVGGQGLGAPPPRADLGWKAPTSDTSGLKRILTGVRLTPAHDLQGAARSQDYTPR